MNKQKSKLIAAVTVGLVCLGMISCKTNYYQVYDVKSNTLTQKDNSLVYENADVRVLYNLWSANGAIGFVFENKTDQDIFIDMGQTFFIKNGAANDYFKNREYSTTPTTNMSLGYSVSNEYLGSEGLWSSKYSVHQAVENFMQGYGCCQSVVAAFADLYGLDDEMAKRIGAGFGGGVGRMRMMCGAVSGIVVLVGLDCGQTEGDDREGKSACYKVVQDLLAKSKEQNGSIICAEILGLKGHEKAQSSYAASARTAEYYKSRPCAAKVESAARIFAEYLMEKK